MTEGEKKAWERLALLDSKSITINSLASYDAIEDSYSIKSFGMDFSVSIPKREIIGHARDNGLLLQKYREHFKFTLPAYMSYARDIPPSGILVNPSDITGGQIFIQGTHILPLDRLAKRYAQDIDGFIKNGIRFGADMVDLGDRAIRLYPFPRLPMTLILRRDDDEFPADAALLFDSTCSYQSPTDVIWSCAMMTVCLMMED